MQQKFLHLMCISLIKRRDKLNQLILVTYLSTVAMEAVAMEAVAM